MDLAATRKKDKLLTTRMPADTWQSIQMISSACRIKVNTCPLPLI